MKLYDYRPLQLKTGKKYHYSRNKGNSSNRTDHKVIIETGYLTTEVAFACECAVEGGAAFVKTSTGFGPRVHLWRI